MTIKLTTKDFEVVRSVLNFPADTWHLGLRYSGLTKAARACLIEIIEGRLTKDAVLRAGGTPSAFAAGQRLS